MEKSKWYVARQKKKYSKIVEKDRGFIEAFPKALKNKDLNTLGEYIIQNDKVREFEEQVFDATLGDIEHKQELLDFGIKVGIDEIRCKYGEEFSNKIQKMCDEEKLGFFDVYNLAIVNVDREKIDEISGLIDIFADDRFKTGIHRTGGSVSGDVISSEGLRLTGHLSSGSINDRFEIEDLDENISFYDSPGLAIGQIACGGNYKNLMQAENIDIVIVAIPIKDIEAREDVILHGQIDILNPKYVQGYVTVNSKENKIISTTRNNKFLDGKPISKYMGEKFASDVSRLNEELTSSVYDSENVCVNYTAQDDNKENNAKTDMKRSRE